MLACDFLRCLCCKQGGMCAVCVCARVCGGGRGATPLLASTISINISTKEVPRPQASISYVNHKRQPYMSTITQPRTSATRVTRASIMPVTCVILP